MIFILHLLAAVIGFAAGMIAIGGVISLPLGICYVVISGLIQVYQWTIREPQIDQSKIPKHSLDIDEHLYPLYLKK